MLIRAIGAAVLVSLGSPSACGSETRGQRADVSSHTVNGLTVDQVFSDPSVARLATLGCSGDQPGIAALRGVVDPNSTGLSGITPLLWALDCRNLAGVEALLRMGADANQSTGGRGGYTPVLVAASVEDPAFLRLLLQHGGDPNSRYEGDGATALDRAFQRGLEGEAWENWNILLEAGADINVAYRGEHGTIATFAANLNRFDKVVELLERGYSHDLTYLGFTVQPLQHKTPFPVPPLGREAEEARARAMAILAQRGVRFPVTRADVGLGNPNVATAPR